MSRNGQPMRLRRLERLLSSAQWLLILLVIPALGWAEPQSQTEFNLRKGELPDQSYLDLFFGSPPPMATERGILVIDAFYDRNANGRRDTGEEFLQGKVICSIDGIDYPIPAFIPGLEFEGSYQLECRGETFQPKYSDQEIFIRNRGQVIEVALPCRPEPEKPRRES